MNFWVCKNDPCFWHVFDCVLGSTTLSGQSTNRSGFMITFKCFDILYGWISIEKIFRVFTREKYIPIRRVPFLQIIELTGNNGCYEIIDMRNNDVSGDDVSWIGLVWAQQEMSH